MSNKIKLEIESSRRDKDYYNIIEDKLEVLIDTVYRLRGDNKYMDVLKAFNNLIKTINRNNLLDTELTVRYIKELRESYYEADAIGGDIVLDYIREWMGVIFENNMKYYPEITNKIVIEYVMDKDRKGLMDFYLYTINKFYKEYSLNWIDM